MNQSNNPTFKEKYQFVQQHKHLLQHNYHKIISDISLLADSESEWKEPSISQPQAFANAIKLETAYKCCMPAYYSLAWQEEVNYKNTNPLTAIVAFHQPGENYYSIDQKFAKWVESGGTRITPLRANISKEKLEFTIKNVDAIVIPEVKEKSDSDTFFEMLAELLNVYKDIPVLAVGNSALFLMSQRCKNQVLLDKVRYQIKGAFTPDIIVYATHIDPYFFNLNLKTRLQIENKPKISSTLGLFCLPSFLKNQNYQKLSCLAIGRHNDQWKVSLARDDLIHYCFLNAKMDGANMDEITFCHKIIVSFTEEIRKRNKNKSEIQVELGHYKMIYADEKYHYNCDLKLPKV